MNRILLAWCWLALSAAHAADPFVFQASLDSAGTGTVLSLSVRIPPKHYLYADQLTVTAAPPATLHLLSSPKPARKHDPFSDGDRDIYDRDIRLTYAVGGPAAGELIVEAAYQGCNDQLCFFPSRTRLTVRRDGSGAAPPAPAAPAAAAGTPEPDDWGARLRDFRVAGSAGGYLKPEAFLRFLERAESGGGSDDDRLRAWFDRRGAWTAAALALLLLLGTALNLTPCVLPMIPVNMAIIGAGAARSGSSGRGLLLGGAYGAAMAFVYGLLGAAVVLTGAKFGTLNSSWGFNAAVAAVFIVLGLAMFDVILIDFSRFQPASAGQARSGGFGLAFFMGALSALLAGACVAPVVISVLVLATDLYARGTQAAVLLPFVLGLGMGLPWPFMGAGLSFLPKPGRWMEHLKKGFGVLILGFALYYGRLAWSLHAERRPESRRQVEAAQAKSAVEGGWLTSLDAALAAARQQEKPVFIDFWASWCKNCFAMDKTTFLDKTVQARLDPYVRVKVRAEDLAEPATRRMLDHFGAVGLPTYVVLAPNRAAAPGGRPETREGRKDGNGASVPGAP